MINNRLYLVQNKNENGISRITTSVQEHKLANFGGDSLVSRLLIGSANLRQENQSVRGKQEKEDA